MSPLEAYIAGVASTVAVLLVIWLARRVLGAWAMAHAAAVPVGFLHIVGMRLRKTDPEVLVGALVVLAKGGEAASPFHLEALYLTLPEDQRNVEHLVKASRALAAPM